MKGDMEKVLGKIRDYFSKADDCFSSEPGKARRYVKLARRLAMKNRIRIPREFQLRFCKHCYSYLRDGSNARIRTREGKLVVYCGECRKHSRYVLK